MNPSKIRNNYKHICTWESHKLYEGKTDRIEGRNRQFTSNSWILHTPLLIMDRTTSLGIDPFLGLPAVNKHPLLCLAETFSRGWQPGPRFQKAGAKGAAAALLAAPSFPRGDGPAVSAGRTASAHVCRAVEPGCQEHAGCPWSPSGRRWAHLTIFCFTVTS